MACKGNHKFQTQYFKHLLNCDFTTLELGLYNYIKGHSNITKSFNNINSPKYHIKDILYDHFEEYLKVMSDVCIIPDYVIKNVNKTIICKTKDLGYDVYCCPECGNTYLNFHTCKSRFCASCGVKYAKDRVIEIQKKTFDCLHRHIVFTIPKELREYFRKINHYLIYYLLVLVMLLIIFLMVDVKAKELINLKVILYHQDLLAFFIHLDEI